MSGTTGRLSALPTSAPAATATGDAREDTHAAPTSALDEVLPQYDFSSRHAIEIAAPAAQVVEALEGYTPSADGSWVTRLLFRLRGFQPGDGARGLRAAFASEGFRVLAERPGREVVLGVAGRFWSLDEPAALDRVADLAAFQAYATPGAAKAVLGLRVEPLGPARTRLATETRVACVDAAARRRFTLYWALIRPASGWIRREMLGAIAHRAAHL